MRAVDFAVVAKCDYQKTPFPASARKGVEGCRNLMCLENYLGAGSAWLVVVAGGMLVTDEGGRFFDASFISLVTAEVESGLLSLGVQPESTSRVPNRAIGYFMFIFSLSCW